MPDYEFHPPTSSRTYKQPWGQHEVSPWTEEQEEQWMREIAARQSRPEASSPRPNQERMQPDSDLAERIIKDIVSKGAGGSDGASS
jgi:hypothetical protein